eukprot:gene13588-15994_t
MKLKKFMVGMMLAATTVSMLGEALARPMGGGRSFGRQSQNVGRQAPAPAPTPAPAAARWKGLLGGALLGLGLGALLSHFGLGGALASMISTLLMVALLAGVAFFIYRMVRGKRDSNTSGNAPFAGFGGNQPAPAGNVPDIGSAIPPLPPLQPVSSGVGLDKPVPVPVPAPAAAPWGVPADFDKEAFLRHAKSNFIRLQAAWDKADVNDIREFTSPEVYAELRMQIQERGAQPDFTDVVSIDAELLGIETSVNDYLASVKFTGMIRSAPGAAAEPFAEVWNMSKPVSGNSGWVLAGIQQLG